jgi:hypothetical protein
VPTEAMAVVTAINWLVFMVGLFGEFFEKYFLFGY